MSHNDPLFFSPPFISVCTIYCVYEAALIWYFITEESDKNTPADSENVQNPLYNLIHPFNIHHFYKFLLLKNTALYPHFFFNGSELNNDNTISEKLRSTQINQHIPLQLRDAKLILK